MSVSREIQLTLSRDVLDALAAGKGPDRALVALGYAGWEPVSSKQKCSPTPGSMCRRIRK